MLDFKLTVNRSLRYDAGLVKSSSKGRHTEIAENIVKGVVALIAKNELWRDEGMIEVRVNSNFC
jgi:hypothetical protein